MEEIKLNGEVEITKDFLTKLMLGGAFLGSGGGGPMHVAGAMIKDILPPGTGKIKINIFSPQYVKDKMPGSWGAVVACMGAPEASQQGEDVHFTGPLLAFETLETTLKDAHFDYCLPIEIGAANSIVPFLVAAKSQKPVAVIDSDGAGRAVPQLENTVIADANISGAPASLTNNPGTNAGESTTMKTIIDVQNDHLENKYMVKTLEDISRGIVSQEEFGQVGGLAMYRVKGDQLPAAVINPSTLGVTLEIGGVFLEAREQKIQNIQYLLEKLKPVLEKYWGQYYLFGPGRVVWARTESEGGFDKGKVVICDQRDETKRLVIRFENENLVAYVNNDSSMWAISPDSICYVSGDGPLSNAEMKEGKEVAVVGLKANPKMRTPFIINGFMSIIRELGFYIGEYIPIEKLQESFKF